MNIIIKYLVAFVISFIVFIANGQETENSLLWKIEGDSIKTAYLFGTIHILPQKDFKIAPKVQKAFNASNELVLELDMDDPNFFKEAMQYSSLKEGESLTSYMDEKEHAILDSFLIENLKVGIAQFSKVKPMMLMSSLLTSFVGEQVASYEFTLISMSKKNNMEVKGLELLATQMAALDSQSYEKQIDDLVELVENYDDANTTYKELVAFYKKEDIQAIYTKSKVYFNNSAELEEKLLDERNRNWIPEMTKLSKENNVFFAVGAAHLGGNQGLINLLKKKGYKVTPILE